MDSLLDGDEPVDKLVPLLMEFLSTPSALDHDVDDLYDKFIDVLCMDYEEVCDRKDETMMDYLKKRVRGTYHSELLAVFDDDLVFHPNLSEHKNACKGMVGEDKTDALATLAMMTSLDEEDVTDDPVAFVERHHHLQTSPIQLLNLAKVIQRNGSLFHNDTIVHFLNRPLHSAQNKHTKEMLKVALDLARRVGLAPKEKTVLFHVQNEYYFPIVFQHPTGVAGPGEKRSKLLAPSSALYKHLSKVFDKIKKTHDVSKRMDFHVELLTKEESILPSMEMTHLREERMRQLERVDALNPQTYSILRGAFVLNTGMVSGYGHTHITVVFLRAGIPAQTFGKFQQLIK